MADPRSQAYLIISRAIEDALDVVTEAGDTEATERLGDFRDNTRRLLAGVGCSKCGAREHHAKGMCFTCYQRERRAGHQGNDT